MGEYQLILACEGMEFVGRRDELLAGDLGNGLGHLHIKSLGRIQPRAHGGSAKGQLL